MDFFRTMSIDEAKSEIDKRAESYNLEFESVDLLSSKGRVSFEDVKSIEVVPAFSRSTVDGYAVNCRDTHGASSTIPSMLTIVDRIEMGKEPNKSIKPGECSYIPTGGMLPEGADAVVMIENAEELDSDTLMIYKAVSEGGNVLRRGDDIDESTILLEKGKTINSYDIGVLASQGISEIKVFRKLKFTIISTGDEIIEIDQKISLGQIRDINSYVLASDIVSEGHEVVKRVIVKDEYDKLRDAVKEGVETSDIVLISGGSSVGTKDYTSDVINEISSERDNLKNSDDIPSEIRSSEDSQDNVFIHGLSIKPGKPTIVGDAGGKLIFGLPGHPASSIIIYNIMVKYAVDSILKKTDKQKSAYCIMESNFPSSPGKTTYQMVKIFEKEENLHAIPVFGKSGMIRLLSEADGYIEIRADEEGIYKGDLRKVIYL